MIVDAGERIMVDVGERMMADAGKAIGRRPLLSRWHITAALQIADFVAIAASVALFFFMAPLADETKSADGDGWVADALIIGVQLSLVLRILGAYSFKNLNRPWLSGTVVIGAWVAVSVPFMLLHARPTGVQAEGGLSLFWWSVVLACFLIATRFIGAEMNRRLSNSGVLAHTICVIGDGDEAQSCIRHFDRETSGSFLLGYFFAGDHHNAGLVDSVCLGHVDQLTTFLRRERVDEICIATSLRDANRMRDLILNLSCLPATLSIWPETLNLPAQAISTGGDWPSTHPSLILAGGPLSGWAWVVKEVQDRTLAALLMLACLPAMLLIAVAIRISSPGPVLFRQMREGYRGRQFCIFKFRTMHVAACEPADKLMLTTRNDSRIFPLGALLRRWSLDELPQLFNILRGDMWLVGPRPHSPFATAADRRYAEAVKRYAARHKIKPGMTGWAQINGWRGPTITIEQIEQRVAHDIYYIDHWSPLLDWRILAMTAVRGFSHQNAF